MHLWSSILFAARETLETRKRLHVWMALHFLGNSPCSCLTGNWSMCQEDSHYLLWYTSKCHYSIDRYISTWALRIDYTRKRSFRNQLVAWCSLLSYFLDNSPHLHCKCLAIDRYRREKQFAQFVCAFDILPFFLLGDIIITIITHLSL